MPVLQGVGQGTITTCPLVAVSVPTVEGGSVPHGVAASSARGAWQVPVLELGYPLAVCPAEATLGGGQGVGGATPACHGVSALVGSGFGLGGSLVRWFAGSLVRGWLPSGGLVPAQSASPPGWLSDLSSLRDCCRLRYRYQHGPEA